MRYTLSLDHQDKLMELGQSRDFTQCKAMVKSGSRRCTNFANMYVLYICMYVCTYDCVCVSLCTYVDSTVGVYVLVYV